MTENDRDVVVGVLGMPDNQATPELLNHLTHDADLQVDFVVYWTPSVRDRWRQLVRKVRAAGPAAALQRVVYALSHRRRSDGGSAPDTPAPPYREYFVPGHNSTECRRILSDEGVDVLVLSTDAIITARTLRIPRIATLNAHPGWVPRDRGLGSNLFRMERGLLPAVSVHAVDEGIDTGPVIVRETLSVDPTVGLDRIEEEVDTRRHELLAEVVRQARKGPLVYVDTFGEPSGLTRGMPARRRRRLDARLRSGHLTLS